MNGPRELIEQYARAFVRADVGALVACFSFPLLVVSLTPDGASTSVAQAEEWPGVLEKLLAAYERLGVTDCVRVSTEVTEPLDALAVVCVHWALQRGNGEPVYDFTAVYTMVRAGGRLQIVAIAHDELPHLRAALSGAQSSSS